MPVADSKIIVRSPMEDLVMNDSNRVPVIVGSTDSEYRLYLMPGSELQKITDKDLRAVINELSLPTGAFQAYIKTVSARRTRGRLCPDHVGLHVQDASTVYSANYES